MQGVYVNHSIDMNDNNVEKELTSVPEHLTKKEVSPCKNEVQRLLDQNFQIKRDLARRLHAAGLPMENIGRVLNLRVKMIKEFHEK
jgi:hypothetical protein